MSVLHSNVYEIICSCGKEYESQIIITLLVITVLYITCLLHFLFYYHET